MWSKIRVGMVAILIGLIAIVSYRYLSGQTIALLQPKGLIAEKERDLIYLATVLMLIVVIPVFFMAFWFPKRYNENSKNAEYLPDWDSNKALEAIWWGVPIAIIGVIAIVTWKSTHELDPFKPLAAANRQQRIQVVAMEWKWLFIYPDEGIVTVNHVLVPKDVPVSFEITSDAPMNSFWIPQLSGQIYAMSGMSTKLHVLANSTGKYEGLSANISGYGFSDMRFIAEVVDKNSYNDWVNNINISSSKFGENEYQQLSIPSVANTPQYFSLSQNDLYSRIVAKYNDPTMIDGLKLQLRSSNFHNHAEDK
ncbi:ubiquinol oxidase subunit II [Candidatus Saccharibacteria bacterium]|nr:ubiquinol oxidase subunit II [Candidatus Saccharibacteria bacterium]